MASAGGSVSKFVGVLAGAPAALRAFARMRHELRGGVLPRRPASGSRSRSPSTAATPTRSPSTRAPPALRASASTRSLAPAAELRRPARGGAAGLPRGAVRGRRAGPPTTCSRRRARSDWSDEQILEAVAHLALNEFQSLMANAAALPQDQSDPSVLPAAA